MYVWLLWVLLAGWFEHEVLVYMDMALACTEAWTWNLEWYEGLDMELGMTHGHEVLEGNMSMNQRSPQWSSSPLSLDMMKMKWI